MQSNKPENTNKKEDFSFFKDQPFLCFVLLFCNTKSIAIFIFFSKQK